MILCVPLLLLSACDVHEMPDPPTYNQLHLKLNFETYMTEWKHVQDGMSIVEQGVGTTYDNALDYGKMRYVIRTFPIMGNQRTSQYYTQEFVFTKNFIDDYNYEVTLDVLPGDYKIMVWADMVETDGDVYFYNAENFSEIKLQGDHKGNCDYRDAFRGTNDITIVSDIVERLPDTLCITMQRPLAKFEFVATDVLEFIDKEFTRIATKAAMRGDTIDASTTKVINIEDYVVAFHYAGYMPNTYNMHTDKPVDSTVGIMFESTLKQLSETSAAVGFDYVFVNGKNASVSVQIGVYDNERTQLSLTDPIEVPLRRSHHTILAGSFLISEASGGLVINPSFDGNHNIIIPQQ